MNFNGSRCLKQICFILASLCIISCGDSGNSSKTEPQNTPGLIITDDVFQDVVGRDGANNLDVLVNDFYSGTKLIPDEIQLKLTSGHNPLSLSENGLLSVAPKTESGSYQLSYEVCLQENTSLCGRATVYIDVINSEIALKPDNVAELNGAKAQTNIINLVANDTMDSGAIPLDEVLIAIKGENVEYFTLNSNAGIDMKADTPAKNYQLEYQICEKLNVNNCSESTVSIGVNKGLFMNGSVAGLKYISSSGTEGYTDQDGAFIYQENDILSFYLGGTLLGISTLGKANISPQDLTLNEVIPSSIKEVNSLVSNLNRANFTAEYLNITSLLYSADKDKNWLNGINIPRELHNSWGKISLKLDLSLSEFYKSLPLKKAMFKAYSENILGSARITHYLTGLDQLIIDQELDIPIYARKNVAIDDGADGIINSKNEFIIDENSFLRKRNDYTVSNTGDETIIESIDTQISTHGELLGQTNYDSLGNLTYSNQIIYNIHGYIVSEITFDKSTLLTTTQTYNYSTTGNLITHNIDNESDNEIDLKTQYLYDLFGNVLSELIYSNIAGELILSQRVFHSYDSDQHLIKTEVDENADGVINSATHYQLDSFGNVTLTSIDSNNDGVPNYTKTDTYDIFKQLTSSVIDSDGDSVADMKTLTIYSLNPLVVIIQEDTNGNGFFEKVTSSEFDDQGYLFKKVTWENGLVSVDTYQFDEFANLIYSATEINEDGKLINVVESDINDQGLISIQYFEDGHDSSKDKIIYYEYQKINFRSYSVITN